MATEKIEYRDEKFETTIDPLGRIIRVRNTWGESITLELQGVRSNFTTAAWLTLDEADQLAEMLRLSARGLRGETEADRTTKAIEQERNRLHKLMQDILSTCPYDMVKAGLEDEFRWALEAADTFMEQS